MNEVEEHGFTLVSISPASWLIEMRVLYALMTKQVNSEERAMGLLGSL